ncbi:ribonuclease HII [Methanosphaera sp. WGK6]|uniref:ribonuclease HII n=1 Tax=Methanosphaera sp. WGK6 TaxID=1561964 RepID=UPI00084C9864|nr:ribonuclease HII [Methanosphaera sp. WGK6]
MDINEDSLVLGIDEAGRGSVIGPLVIGGVLMPKKKTRFLDRIGVKDSKKLSSKKRTVLSRKIKKIAKFTTFIINAQEIDYMRNNGTNLNQIETNGMQNIINQMNPDICCIDCIDVNETRFHDNIQKINQDMKVITKHKADDIYNIVSAASIIAKVERDKQLAIIRSEYGPVGSGYPSDKNTIDYLKTIKNNEFPPIVRQTWSTIENMKNR